MEKKRKLFSYIEVDDNTPIQKLGVMDQLRVLIRKLGQDDASELIAEDAVTQNLLQLKADLLQLLDDALMSPR